MPNITIANNTNIDDVFAVRTQVFCEEQGVAPTIERDGLDNTATHLLATVEEKPIGCCRLLWEKECAHMGRLAVLQEYRNNGIGKALCQFAMAVARERGCHTLWLNAQLTSLGFYQKLGFVAQGEIFVEANMEHVKVEIKL